MTTLSFDVVGNDKSGTKALNNIADGVDKVSKRMDLFSANAVAGLAEAGAKAGAMFTSALENATSFEASTDKLSAQLGLSGKVAKEFGGIAGDLYANAYGESMADVTDAVKSVWSQGLVDEDAATADIKDVAATAMNFSTGMEQDMERVTGAVGTMLKTGMAKNATEAFDVLTRGFQQGANKADDLLDTFIEYSTQFRKLGLDGTSAMGLIQQGLKGGARDADTVADALKEFSIRAVDGSTATGTAFKQLGLDGQKMAADIAAGGPKASEGLQIVLDRLRGMKDPVAQSAAAVGLFGTKAEDLGQALFSLNPSTAVDALGNVAGASKKMGDTLNDNAQSKITTLKRSMEMGIVNFFGGKVIPAIQGVVQWLRDHFGGALDNLGKILNEVAMPALAALGALMLATGIKMAIAWITGMGPIAPLIAAVVFLAGIIISNWDSIVAALSAAWEFIKNAAKAGIDWIVGIWTGFTGWIGGIISKIAGRASGMWEGAKSAVTAVKDWIVARFNDVVGFFTSIPTKVGQALAGIGTAIGNAFKGALNIAIDIINWFIDRANDIIYGINVINPFTDIPSIPKLKRLHEGGVVPGSAGSERLAILEAGETVIPADTRIMRGGGGVSTLVVGPNADSKVAELINYLVRTGQIRVQ